MSDESGVSVVIEDKVTPVIAKLARQIGNLEPVLDEIGASNVTETQHRFETETSPDGVHWQGLSASTLARRGASAKILRHKGNLYDSLTHKTLSNAVRVGTNRVYGRIHQLGGKAGRGHKVTIPARPYLGISAEGRKQVVEIMKAHIEAAAS